jgi:PAS domain S-box-containing protein
MTNKHEIYINAAKTAKIGIWEVNLETNQVYWDAVTKCILEVSEDFKPLRGYANNFFPEGEIREQFKMLIKKAIEEGITFEEKFQIITAKDNIKYVKCICRAEFTDTTVTRIFGSFQDITKEQNLINKLGLSVEKFSSVFSSANDAIVIIDSTTGIITDCNSRFHELTEYNCSEIIGLHNFELFPVNKRKEIKKFLANKLNKDNYFVKETYLKSKFGKIIPVEVASGKKFIVENKAYLVCFFRDISERKNADESLNMLSLVASETTDAIIIANTEGEALWANKAYLKLTGFTMAEILNKKTGFLLKGPETDLKTFTEIREAVKDKKDLKSIILYYNKRNEKFWFESNITPVFDNKGNCIKFICVGRDATSAKEKELELKRILEVTSQQNNKLFNFSHIVSHNIRSHASNLSMVLDVMENTENINERLSYIDMFREGTEKLSETIEYLNEIITIQKNTNIEKKDIRLKDEIEKQKRHCD